MRTRTPAMIPVSVTAAMLLAWLAMPAAARADGADPTLDQALHQHAPKVIEHLRGKGYGNVGVLKFLIRNDGKLLDNVGPLNLSIANRLEVALVLANPDEKLGIIERASEAIVRMKNELADHHSENGRKALFESKYPLAWGKKEVKADAFVTGIVEIDGRKMHVTLQAFDKKDNRLEQVCKFTAAADARTFAETGRSYLVKGAKGAVEKYEKAEDHLPPQDQLVSNLYPLESDQSPLELTIYYNGNKVPIEKGKVREPKQGDKVSFLVKNMSRQRYGVVLKVNGENSLFREKLTPHACYKWILEPSGQRGDQVWVIGYKLKDRPTAEEFVGLPRTPADEARVRYEEHAGTFTVVAFPEDKNGKANPILFAQHEEEASKVGSISKGSLSFEGIPKPGSLKALQALLRAKGSSGPRFGARIIAGAALFTIGGEGGKGFIGTGQEKQQEVQEVSFKAARQPLLIAHVRYYNPGNNK